MAIKVIKQGVDPKNVYVSKCVNCGTVFSYGLEDRESPISAWHEFHVLCPTCGFSMAWNNNPKTTEPLVCESSIITRFKHTCLVPQGAKAYTIRQSTTEIRLYPVDTIIPSGVPVLLIGSFTEIESVPGLGSSVPTGEEGTKIQIEEFAGQELFIITPDFKLRKMTAADKSPSGISTVRIQESFSITVVQ